VIKDEKGNNIDVLDKMAESHRKLTETALEYNTQKAELKYRYPEEGVIIERRYVPLRAQTIEQIEKELGLSSELTKTKKKIDKKYAPFVGEAVTAAPEKQTVVADPTYKEKPKPGVETPARLKLTK
jgi:hypothetical protein